MDLDSLIVILPTKSPSSIKEWLNEFTNNHVDADIDEFLAHLRDESLISDLEFLEAVNGQSLSLGGDTLINQLCSAEQTEETEGEGVEGFDIIDLLGEGAMGMVHVARDVELKRRVALKSIHAETNDDKGKERFLREILITAQLDHPNIMQIYSMEKTVDGRLAYTMKWIKGRVLTDFIQDCVDEYEEGISKNALSLNDRLEVFLKLCDAMYYAHQKKVIHRDLKPDNIMIGAFGEAIVVDWGIARRIGDTRDENDPNPKEEIELVGDAQTTQDGAIVGSVGYMSPEQARGDIEELDGKSDQYALGLILFELVTLVRGISDGRLMDMLRRARRGQIAPFVHRSFKVKIREELVAIIEKATENDSRNRYADVDALADDVRRFLREEPVLVRPDPPLTKITRWISKNRTKALFTFLSVGIFALVSNLYNLHVQQQEREEHHQLQEELREQASLRAKQLGELITSVSSQGHKIDERLLFYQGFLRELAATAETRLQLLSPLEPPPMVYLNENYAIPEQAPVDLVDSDRYKKKMSVDHAVIKLAPNVQLMEDVLMQAQHLASLQPTFKAIFIESAEQNDLNDKEIRKMILEDGTPLVWALVATETGIHSAYPGKGGYKAEYDPRARPWYKNSIDTEGPHCQAPYQDAMGQGLILPCTMTIHQENGTLMGVAGVEFTFSFIVQHLLSLPTYSELTKSYLVDGEGKIMISSDQEKDQQKLFPMERVVNDIKRKQSGYLLVNKKSGEKELVFYSYLETSGWYYIVSGLEKKLLPVK